MLKLHYKTSTKQKTSATNNTQLIRMSVNNQNFSTMY